MAGPTARGCTPALRRPDPERGCRGRARPAAPASSAGRRTFEWPLAKDGRQHVHSRIDGAELPVTHLTRRQGRPYTLVLYKTDALFTREHEARVRDETDLAWLAGEWTGEPAIPDAR